MNFLKKFILILLFLFPISNSFASMVSLVHSKSGLDNGIGEAINGVDFNNDGTKMFIVFQQSTATYAIVEEYTLSTPFNITTASYAGDSEICSLDTGDTTFGPVSRVYDIDFSRDGMKLLVARGGSGSTDANDDRVFMFNLTSPFDVSTCSFANDTNDLDSDTLQEGSNAGDPNSAGGGSGHSKNRAQAIKINDDGTKLFITMQGAGSLQSRLLEYNLSTPYDLETISLVTSAGINLESSVEDNPNGLDFSKNGKRLFVVSHNNGQRSVTQISLTRAFDTSSFTIDGTIKLTSISGVPTIGPRGLAFSSSGLKMYVLDADSGSDAYEFDLVCPFNLFSGECSPITENNDRTGTAEAQVELAKRTIKLSTNSALNRLKWIRRNKDKQNLSNQNVKLNFSNNMLSSLKVMPISSFKKISNSKNKKDSNKNYFYWSEGNIYLGRVGDTSIASTKKVNTNALTFGLDRFTDDYGLEGLAFRFGSDDVDVGSDGSNLDSNTYNITYYSTSPIKDDTKYLDKIFGIGKIRSDILSVVDGKNLTADRTGNQIYGTFKIKDEYKRDKLTFIPSGQFDFGHTILRGYQEAGTGAIEVEDQHVRTKNLRAAMAVVEDLSSDKYTLKRHGKLEYVAELDRSSNFKYTYVGDGSVKFNDTLHTGALHNLNGEIGIDIIFPEHYSVFIIYERNHAFGTGYSDNLYIALGYLPHEDTEYAFSINGSENLISKFEIKKNINGYDLSFDLNDDLTNLGDSKEASINLNKVF
jgi:hypothetical protein